MRVPTSEITPVDESTSTTTSTTTAAPEPKDEEFKRPEAIYFVAERRPDGEPHEHLAGYGIDARDYPTGDPLYRRLTDDQVKLALDSGLYQRTKPTGAKAEAIAQATAPAASPAAKG